MAIALASEKLARYKDLARLLVKYGRGDLLSLSGLEESLTEEDRRGIVPADPKAEELARDLEAMGPVYVKLGQVLSSRGDILPEEYVRALARLQDKLAPFPFEQAREIVEEELGVRLSKAFQRFDPEPFGVASLGQAHRAALRDGREVVVKVQRPGIRTQIQQDMEALTEIAGFLDQHTELGRKYRVAEMLEQFKKNLVVELDYRQEAAHLLQIGHNLRDFDRIVVPRPVEDYTTSRVLTMDFISGRKITDLGPLGRLEIDGDVLADQLFRAYLQQILVDGIFHADPHPGNVLITWTPETRPNIGLIDLGMVGRVAPGMQDQLLKLLIAVADGRTDEAADAAIEIGEPLEDFDEAEFRRRVAELIVQHKDSTARDIQIGRVMLQFTRSAGVSGIRMPAELSMLAKALLNLDEIARTLDPDFNPNQAIRQHVAEILRRKFMKSLTPGNLFASAMEARELAQEMPARINRILDLISRNQLKVEVNAIDENLLIQGFQKVANRIATGLVLAALIVGAALLMQVKTAFRLFGYPGLAMLCFIAAAAGGFYLVLSIFLSDRRDRPRDSH